MRRTFYTCINCDKSFDRKSNYLAHLNRKVPCVLQPITMNKLKEETNENLELKDKKINEIENEIKELKEQMALLLSKKD